MSSFKSTRSPKSFSGLPNVDNLYFCLFIKLNQWGKKSFQCCSFIWKWPQVLIVQTFTQNWHCKKINFRVFLQQITSCKLIIKWFFYTEKDNLLNVLFSDQLKILLYSTCQEKRKTRKKKSKGPPQPHLLGKASHCSSVLPMYSNSCD